MMMTYKSAGVPYTVEVTEDWKRVDHSEHSAGHLRGQIDYMRHSIRVAGDAPIERVRRVALHEIIHSLVDGYSISALETEDGEGHIEPAIDLLSVGIAEFLETADDSLLELFNLTRE